MLAIVAEMGTTQSSNEDSKDDSSPFVIVSKSLSLERLQKGNSRHHSLEMSLSYDAEESLPDSNEKSASADNGSSEDRESDKEQESTPNGSEESGSGEDELNWENYSEEKVSIDFRTANVDSMEYQDYEEEDSDSETETEPNVTEVNDLHG